MLYKNFNAVDQAHVMRSGYHLFQIYQKECTLIRYVSVSIFSDLYVPDECFDFFFCGKG